MFNIKNEKSKSLVREIGVNNSSFKLLSMKNLISIKILINLYTPWIYVKTTRTYLYSIVIFMIKRYYLPFSIKINLI